MVLTLAWSAGAAAQSNISPTSPVVVTAAQDWATSSFQDPIDMNQNTDLGWFIYDSTSTWTSPSFVDDSNPQHPGNRLFTATSGSNSYVSILETGNPYSARLGRTGDNYSINTAAYRTVALRMNLPGAEGVQRTSPTSYFRFLWWTKTIYDADTVMSQSGAPFNRGGWGVYLIDLPTLGMAPYNTGGDWLSTGTVRTLRLDPTTTAGDAVTLDWVRLVALGSEQTVTWGGGGVYDIYLDTRGTACDGDLGLIVKAVNGGTIVSTARTSGAFSFQASALPAGDYVVALKSGSTFRCSTGYYRVNDIPTLTFTSPSPEGSTDDFATVQLNDAWDLNATTDMDLIGCVTSPAVTALASAERPDGTNLGPNLPVFKGTSFPAGAASDGNSCDGERDPALFFLWPGGFGRGATYSIDTSRYRILTLDMGLPGQRNLHPTDGGSVARVYWRDKDDPSQTINASQDIIINHRAGANVLHKTSLDMATLLREVYETPGWTGNVDYFRIDPHEFPDATDFWLRPVKLAAFERVVNQQYTIRWTYADPFYTSSPTLTVYYDRDRNPTNGFAGTACGPVNPSAVSSCTWNMVGAFDTYYLYAAYGDGLNTNGTYATWPVVYDGSTGDKPRLVLNRSRLNFGGTDSGATKTSAQQVRLNVVGAGTVSWTATVEPTRGGPNWVTVWPTAGTGSDTLTIGIKDVGIDNNLIGDWIVKVSSPDASNSPQYIRVYLKMYQRSAVRRPTGALDMPTGATTVSGSIVVGGWATDDIEISKIEVFRDRVAGEPLQGFLPPGHPGADKIYVATAEVVHTRPFGPDTALFVDDARTDIAGLFPANPWHYRAGWGYLMLTRGLPNSGTGTYKLYAYAFDKDGTYPGDYTLLGSRTFTADNRATTPAAQKPFGAIDSPFPGETVSGIKLTGGWALTQPATCRVTSVQVGVDSGPLKPVIYGDAKPGFEATFPPSEFADSPNCGAAYFLDTRAYSNGIHQIAYLVEDDCGHQDGIGSRYFSIFNTGNSLTTETAADLAAEIAEPPQAEAIPPGPTFADIPRVETMPPQPATAQATNPPSTPVEVSPAETIAPTAGTDGAPREAAMSPQTVADVGARGVVAEPTAVAGGRQLEALAGFDAPVIEPVLPQRAAPSGAMVHPPPAGLADAGTAFPRLGLSATVVTAPDLGGSVLIAHGYPGTSGFATERADLGSDGVRTVSVEPSVRVEVHLVEDVGVPPGGPPEAVSYSAYRVVDDQLRALPTGSSFDTEHGIFYWDPAPGYFGTYDFLFVRTRGAGGEEVWRVRLEVGPAGEP